MDKKIEALQRYNFWDKEVLKTGFSRSYYLDKVSKYINNSLIKVLVGQRRSGKSFLMRQIVAQLIERGVNPRNIFYLNMEMIEFDEIRDYKSLNELIEAYKVHIQPQGKVYLLIDEIQNIFQWEKLINSFSQNYADGYEVFITGSNSKMLSGELSSLLSGRYVSFEVMPFSFDEYLEMHRLERSKQSYLQYMNTGGLPELQALPDEETRHQYVNAVKDTVLLRDVVFRHAVKEPKLLEDIFIYLINTASNLISITNITNYFKSRGRKTSYDTIANYIGYIEDTFVVHKAERYDIRGKDTISGNAKYYPNDLAFKNYLFGGFAHGIGYQLENLIYLELRRCGYQVYVGVLPNKEVDFVARKADRILYVQAAYILSDETIIAREYGALEGINDNYEKLVVTLDDVHLPSRSGIKHIQAWNLHSIL